MEKKSKKDVKKRAKYVRGFLNYWRNLLTTFHGIEKGVCGKIKGKKSHPQHPIFTRLGVQLFPSLSLFLVNVCLEPFRSALSSVIARVATNVAKRPTL